MQDQINSDLEILTSQLLTHKVDMDNAIRTGGSFIEVKMIHLKIKKLTRLIHVLKGSESMVGKAAKEYSKL